jgi:molybdenum cofactor cytidylyltransferase
MSPGIECIVLAAGASSRFGTKNKLTATIEGVPVIRKVVSLFTDHPIALPVTVVTGHEAECVTKALAELPVRIAHNKAWQDGMGSSLATGAQAIQKFQPQGILVCLGDLPYLTVPDIEVILDTFHEVKASRIVVPKHSGRRGHPIIFPGHYLNQLQSLTGETGAREIIRINNPLIFHTPSAGIYQDVDRVADLPFPRKGTGK